MHLLANCQCQRQNRNPGCPGQKRWGLPRILGTGQLVYWGHGGSLHHYHRQKQGSIVKLTITPPIPSGHGGKLPVAHYGTSPINRKSTLYYALSVNSITIVTLWISKQNGAPPSSSPNNKKSSALWENRGESRHAVARAICHGQRGEIRKRYREDQLGALGLVTNALVLWNTIYMQAVLDHLRQQGEKVKAEEEARLSPLIHKHVNMLGHYSFTLAEQVMNGRLRPLKQPEEMEDWP